MLGCLVAKLVRNEVYTDMPPWVVLQVDAGIDVNSQENVIPMHKTVEEEFDRMRVCILPIAPDQFQVSAARRWICNC